MHKSSMLKMEYFKDSYLNKNEELKILDVGSFDKTGNYNYKMVLNEKKWSYTGLDLREGNNVDIIIENAYLFNRFLVVLYRMLNSRRQTG